MGYGNRPPKIKWPNDARLALSLVVNYEEGAERSILDGDDSPERFSEIAYGLTGKMRDLAVESMYEYGSRVGFWRIMRLFEENDVKATFFACAKALERNPEAAKAIVKADHEICSHGYRWDEHFYMSKEEERESIRKAISSFQKTAGQRPYGWYCRYGPGVYTRELLVDEGFIYDSDSYNDDVPYVLKLKGRDYCVVPYSIDCNDFHFWLNRFATTEEFFQYLRDTFDVLYAEGKDWPRLMSVGLHLRIIGRPGRITSLEKFIKYARGFPGVWFTRRLDIAKWWLKHNK